MIRTLQGIVNVNNSKLLRWQKKRTMPAIVPSQLEQTLITITAKVTLTPHQY